MFKTKFFWAQQNLGRHKKLGGTSPEFLRGHEPMPISSFSNINVSRWVSCRN